MIFVIPMAGRGSRFLKQGYALPKYMIEVKGKTLFDYSMSSIPLEIAKKIIFICLKEHDDSFKVLDFIYNSISQALHKTIKVIMLDKVTKGQAETVLRAKESIKINSDIVIYNIDTCFSSKTLKETLRDSSKKRNGIIGAFVDKSTDDKWSFAQTDARGKVIKTAEKTKISNYALTGLYHFSKAEDFFTTAQNWMMQEKTIKNEYYIAPMYNDLIQQGKEFVLDVVDEFIPLGTPEEVKQFEATK